jgi:hypothetical protein
VRRLLTALSACTALLAASSAYADVIHNGSVMEVVTFPDHINIQYVIPRPVLQSVGVRPGTTILTGAFHGTAFQGTAWIFSVCGSFSYKVSGGLAPDGALVLDGPEPDLRSDCNIYGQRWGSQSHLVFTEVGQHLVPPTIAGPIPVPVPVPVPVPTGPTTTTTHVGPTTTQQQKNENNQEVHIEIIMPKDYKAAPPQANVVKKERPPEEPAPSEKQPN